MATIQKRYGKYRARIRRRGSVTLTKTFLSKSTAQAWVRKTESELERKTYLDTTEAENTNVSGVLERYQKEVLTDERQLSRELSRLRLFKRTFGSLKLADLNALHISHFQRQRLKYVKPATVRSDLSVLSVVLSYVTKDWNIPLPQGNPIRNVSISQGTKW